VRFGKGCGGGDYGPDSALFRYTGARVRPLARFFGSALPIPPRCLYSTPEYQEAGAWGGGCGIIEYFGVIHISKEKYEKRREMK